MYQDFFSFFLFLVFCFLKFFSVNSLKKKKRTHQEKKMEVGFLNWFELDNEQSSTLASSALATPIPALSQPSWFHPHLERLLQEDPGARPQGLDGSASCHPTHSARTPRMGPVFLFG